MKQAALLAMCIGLFAADSVEAGLFRNRCGGRIRIFQVFRNNNCRGRVVRQCRPCTQRVVRSVVTPPTTVIESAPPPPVVKEESPVGPPAPLEATEAPEPSLATDVPEKAKEAAAEAAETVGEKPEPPPPFRLTPKNPSTPTQQPGFQLFEPQQTPDPPPSQQPVPIT